MSYSAVQAVANQVLPAGALAATGFNPDGPNLGAALNHSAAAAVGGLQGMADIKGELLAACNDPTFAQAAADICQPQGPTSPHGLFAQNALSMAVGTAITAAATFVNPALGAVVGAASAAHGVVSSLAGGMGLAKSSEPPPHAALTSAASFFEAGFYQDAEGGICDPSGVYVSAEAVDPTKIMASSGNGQPPAQALHREPTAAELIVRNLGPEIVRDQLAAQSAQEAALSGQAARARRTAEINGYDLDGGYHLPRVAAPTPMRA